MVFCDRYAECLNISQAAADIGYTYQRGWDLVNTHPVCSEYIKWKIKKRLEEMSISEENILRELASIGFANPLDYVEWDGDKMSLISSEDLTRAQAAGICKISPVVSAGHQIGVSIEFHGKQKALDTLAKHVGILTQPASGKKNDPVHTVDLGSALIQAWEKIEAEDQQAEGKREDPE